MHYQPVHRAFTLLWLSSLSFNDIPHEILQLKRNWQTIG